MTSSATFSSRSPLVRLGLFTVCLAVVGFAGIRAHVAQEEKAAQPGLLKLTIVDEATGKPTPARLELLDEQGKGYVAEDALTTCNDWLWQPALPYKGTVEEAMKRLSVKKVVDPERGTDQFYCEGKAQVSVPAGTYQLRAVKGNEYRVAAQEIRVPAGETTEATVTLKRWANEPKDGWYSADTHIHIPRPVKEFNPFVSKMMQAEDIHIAGLLQWGDSRQFQGAPQYAFGMDGVYSDGDYLLVSAQESTRSTIGHAVILGGRSPINSPDKYLVYKNFWEEARRQEAIAGVCHGGYSGLPIDLPDGLQSVIEVLQFRSGMYGTWYDVLNSGFRMTPIAGTDHPCGPQFPGRERFYVRVDGPLSYDGWLKGLRQGITFVSNGPVLEFRVDGKEIGSDIILKKPGSVSIEGRVRFDADRDDIQRVEVMENGTVIRSFMPEKESAAVVFQFKHEVSEAAWLAVRASGTKREKGLPSKKEKPPSQALAHSGAIYLSIDNSPGLAAHRRAKLLAVKWLGELDALEKRLNITDEQLVKLGSDGADIKRNREEFFQRIAAARKYFQERSR